MIYTHTLLQLLNVATRTTLTEKHELISIYLS